MHRVYIYSVSTANDHCTVIGPRDAQAVSSTVDADLPL